MGRETKSQAEAMRDENRAVGCQRLLTEVAGRRSGATGWPTSGPGTQWRARFFPRLPQREVGA